MGLAGQNQVRHMYVGASPASTVTTMETLKSAGVANDFLLLGKDGSAVSAGGDFKLFQKDALGNIISSDTVKTDNVLHVKSSAYTPAVPKAYEFGGFTADANTLYTVNIEIQGHGSLSQEDTYLKQGYYKAAAGDDARDICDGLVASLNRNFSRELGSTASSNVAFTFSASGTTTAGKIKIEGKEQGAGFDGNKKTKVYDDFIVDISAANYPTSVVVTGGSKGVGTGYQVMEMEYFLLGERGDTYRQNGYPHNIVGPALVSNATGSYDLIEICYYDEGRDEAKKSKKTITIAQSTAAAPNANVNSVIADLNTILGANSVEEIKAS